MACIETREGHTHGGTHIYGGRIEEEDNIGRRGRVVLSQGGHQGISHTRPGSGVDREVYGPERAEER